MKGSSAFLWCIGIAVGIGGLIYWNNVKFPEIKVQQRQDIIRSLPDDCTMHTIGPYGNVSDVFFIRCANSDTSTQGKTTFYRHKYRTNEPYQVEVTGKKDE